MDLQNKRIVICCDGTWNTPQQPTNVVKLLRSIKAYSDDGKHQVVFYDQGVGTYNPIDKFIGGAFGKGVEQNVLDAYRFIAHNYQQGDELYCFGFSRGAYTARALGGMLHCIGLLAKDELHRLPAAYQYYRTPPSERNSLAYEQNLKPDIKLMAVWDTVGALGAPTPLLRRFTKPMVGFFNTHLSSGIKNAYQALAIDERRGVFQPDLWTGDINSDQTVEQTWFAGVHSDIGGGYEQATLSNVALSWIVHKARVLDLDFSNEYLSYMGEMHADDLHDSYGLGYQAMEKLGVKQGVRQLQGDIENPPLNIAIHESVIQRMELVESYQPINFINTLPIARTDERRYFARLKTGNLKGLVQKEKEAIGCQILDYSPLGGVRIQCDETLEASDTLAISSARFAKTLATCVWQKGNTYGLHFAA
ncbi:MAG: DUF2235 domain-containing protein [Gammaproteobacteria bacterium]|nr:DUF2235 domain-containing protein [Gammaproteobacteria bacterium]MBQ0841211.1 DUF2235 domain-containing protein [Gammaproteobacteria bacterium]